MSDILRISCYSLLDDVQRHANVEWRVTAQKKKKKKVSSV